MGVVSDEDFYLAYIGRPGTPSQKTAADNRGIINKVTSFFARQLPPDELESCGMRGLMRTLDKHRDDMGQKFTTSLWFFVRNECLHSLRRNKRWANMVDISEVRVPEVVEEYEDNTHLLECLDLLPLDIRKLLDQYYCQELTLEEVAARNLISKETARIRIKRAVETLRGVLEEQELASC